VGLMRANIGAQRPVEGWINFDIAPLDEADPAVVGTPYVAWDVRTECYRDFIDEFDYAVCSFMLQELDFHELPGALENIRAILKPGGWLRVLVPDIVRAFNRYRQREETWFPQDERTGGLDEKFCTYVTWFGTSKSVFTHWYMSNLLRGAGFEARSASIGYTSCTYRGITELDSRPKEALVMEGCK
jgi:predicted SAM-dependent methyltransferase